MKAITASLYFFCIIICTGCRQEKKLFSHEGFINVHGGRIWYKVIAGPKAGDQEPLVMFHGGPGFASYYLSPLFALADERPVIVYDQLGCGRSDRITDTSLMTIAEQVRDVEDLLDELQVGKFDLYGHSCGTVLAVEYYFQHPDKISRLILASPVLSTRRWETDTDTLIATMPDPERRILQQMKRGIKHDSVLEAKALDLYFASFYNYKHPISAQLDSSIAQSGNNLYTHMGGGSELMAGGTLKDYNSIHKLGRIKVPTLLTAGEFDVARPATVRFYHSKIPGSRFVMISNAAHSTMNDNTQADLAAIRSFLK